MIPAARMQAILQVVDQFNQAMRRMGEQAAEAAHYFGLLGRRVHHRGRGGRWQQHLKLDMITEGYRLTRRGWTKY